MHERNPLRHCCLKRIHNKMNDVINQGNKINLIISSGNKKKQVLQGDKRRKCKIALKTGQTSARVLVTVNYANTEP